MGAPAPPATGAQGLLVPSLCGFWKELKGEGGEEGVHLSSASAARKRCWTSGLRHLLVPPPRRPEALGWTQMTCAGATAREGAMRCSALGAPLDTEAEGPSGATTCGAPGCSWSRPSPQRMDAKVGLGSLLRSPSHATAACPAGRAPLQDAGDRRDPALPFTK